MMILALSFNLSAIEHEYEGRGRLPARGKCSFGYNGEDKYFYLSYLDEDEIRVTCGAFAREIITRETIIDGGRLGGSRLVFKGRGDLAECKLRINFDKNGNPVQAKFANNFMGIGLGWDAVCNDLQRVSPDGGHE